MTRLRELPSGTVTFLFTDVEGSTKLLHELGADRYAEALAEHRRVIRESCTTEGGVEVDTQGDAFFFAFPTASGAVAAASAMTDELARGPIQVRIGLHTGAPLLTDEGYVGDDVHFAARVASSGHGGQVILSAATAEIIELELADLGEHRLKDITEAVLIFQLGNGSFPPLKTISNTNLPTPASSFVGRDDELLEVLSRFEDGARLVTLTGPGGTGKTRLAIEAAATLVPEFKAGVFWVGLATLRDPALVTETIAQTLGAKDDLAEHIGERDLLLLLDNLEQVIDCASELSELLTACLNLTLLVTSRELLRIQGEVEYAVPPLAEPEAVSLFCARSQLQPSEEITELCRRLDDLPLAVELAAARTSAMTPEQILERLSQRLDLLKGGRDADPRQQTLRATIEWSYELLSEDEQHLFARLSVFAGGCTLEAAEGAANADLDHLQSLVEKSLLRFSNRRYWMLETIREYASELLDASEQADVVKGQHANYVLQLAKRAREGLDRGDPRTLDVVDTELGNIRASLAWLGGHDQPRVQLDLVLAVVNFWSIRGGWRECLRWAEESLAETRAERDWRRADGLVAAAVFANQLGDSETAKLYAGESLSISRELGDSKRIAAALMALAVVVTERGEYARAERLLETAIVQAQEVNETTLVADAQAVLGSIALKRGDYDRALTTTEQSLALFGESGNVEGIGWARYVLALALFHAERDQEAFEAAKESLTISREMGHVLGCVWNLTLLGALAARRGHDDLCARLIGAAEAFRAPSDLLLTGADADLRRTTEDELRQRIGDARYEYAFADGHAMSLDEAVEYALGDIDA